MSPPSSILRYARGELAPLVDRREKPGVTPPLQLRVYLSEDEQSALIEAAKRARVSVPKFDLLRARLSAPEAAP